MVASARNWSAVISPSGAYAIADTVPFAAPRITLAFSQRRNGSDDVKLMMVLWPTCDTSPSVIRPAGASPAVRTSAGIPPGHEDDAGRV